MKVLASSTIQQETPLLCLPKDERKLIVSFLDGSNRSLYNLSLTCKQAYKEVPSWVVSIPYSCPKLTDDIISKLTKLFALELYGNEHVTTKISTLTNLTYLGLGGYHKILGESVIPLTNLKSLDLSRNPGIGYKSIIHLPLTDLNLSNNSAIIKINKITSLTKLNLAMNFTIKDESISSLTGLTDLNISMMNLITEQGIRGLTNLKILNLAGNDKIMADKVLINLSNLTNLTDLDIHSSGIKLCDLTYLKSLTNLTKINMDYDDTMDCDPKEWLYKMQDKLTSLTNLTMICAGWKKLTGEPLSQLLGISLPYHAEEGGMSLAGDEALEN